MLHNMKRKHLIYCELNGTLFTPKNFYKISNEILV